MLKKLIERLEEDEQLASVFESILWIVFIVYIILTH